MSKSASRGSTKKAPKKSSEREAKSRAVKARAAAGVSKKRVRLLTRLLTGAAKTEARRLRKFEKAHERRMRVEAALAAAKGTRPVVEKAASAEVPAAAVVPAAVPRRLVTRTASARTGNAVASPKAVTTSEASASPAKPAVSTKPTAPRRRTPQRAPKASDLPGTVAAIPVAAGSKTNGSTPE